MQRPERSSAFSTFARTLGVSGQRAPRYDGKHYIGFSKIFHHHRPQAAGLVEKALTESLPVYAVFLFKEQAEEEPARLPQVDGYVWITVDDPTAEPAVLRLSPVSSQTPL